MCAIAALLWLPAGPAQAQDGLPADVVATIQQAAQSGRETRARLPARTGQVTTNLALEVAVVSALVAHPDRYDAILAAATSADPEASESLVANVSKDFPGLAAGQVVAPSVPARAAPAEPAYTPPALPPPPVAAVSAEATPPPQQLPPPPSTPEAAAVLPSTVEQMEIAPIDIGRPADVAASIRKAASVGIANRERLIFQPTTPTTNFPLETAVVNAIAGRPGDVEQIIADAVAADPAARDTLVANVSDTYPGFAERIRGAAAGTAVPTVPTVSTTDTTLAAVPQPAAETQTAVTPTPTPPAPSPVLSDDDLDEIEAINGETAIDQVNDPWEGFNRAMFTVNDVLDTYILAPIATAYGFVFPDFAKQMLQRGFDNLSAPVRLANDLLQWELGDAGVTTGRFLFNTLAGLGGLLDPAGELGLHEKPSDFGQTLHAYGVPSGPYLVLPILGPSTLRDAGGSSVDSFFQPLGYFLPFEYSIALSGSEAIVDREPLLGVIDDLKSTSIDYYASIRSIYLQDRAAELDRTGNGRTSGVDPSDPDQVPEIE